ELEVGGEPLVERPEAPRRLGAAAVREIERQEPALDLVDADRKDHLRPDGVVEGGADRLDEAIAGALDQLERAEITALAAARDPEPRLLADVGVDLDDDVVVERDRVPEALRPAVAEHLGPSARGR